MPNEDVMAAVQEPTTLTWPVVVGGPADGEPVTDAEAQAADLEGYTHLSIGLVSGESAVEFVAHYTPDSDEYVRNCQRAMATAIQSGL